MRVSSLTSVTSFCLKLFGFFLSFHAPFAGEKKCIEKTRRREEEKKSLNVKKKKKKPEDMSSEGLRQSGSLNSSPHEQQAKLEEPLFEPGGRRASIQQPRRAPQKQRSSGLCRSLLSIFSVVYPVVMAPLFCGIFYMISAWRLAAPNMQGSCLTQLLMNPSSSGGSKVLFGLTGGLFRACPSGSKNTDSSIVLFIVGLSLTFAIVGPAYDIVGPESAMIKDNALVATTIISYIAAVYVFLWIGIKFSMYSRAEKAADKAMGHLGSFAVGTTRSLTTGSVVSPHSFAASPRSFAQQNPSQAPAAAPTPTNNSADGGVAVPVPTHQHFGAVGLLGSSASPTFVATIGGVVVGGSGPAWVGGQPRNVLQKRRDAMSYIAGVPGMELGITPLWSILVGVLASVAECALFQNFSTHFEGPAARFKDLTNEWSALTYATAFFLLSAVNIMSWFGLYLLAEQQHRLRNFCEKAKINDKDIAKWAVAWQHLLQDMERNPLLCSTTPVCSMMLFILAFISLLFGVLRNLSNSDAFEDVLPIALFVGVHSAFLLGCYIYIVNNSQTVIERQHKAVSELQNTVQLAMDEASRTDYADEQQLDVLRAKVRVLQALDRFLVIADPKPKILNTSLDSLRWAVINFSLFTINATFLLLYLTFCLSNILHQNGD